MKLLKWVLIVAGAIVVLFAGALAFIAATFDPNQYKAEVAKLVKDKAQRTLTIEGDIRLMLFPKLGVHLGRTRLSEFKGEKDFAGLDEIRVSLALIPLLSRQVVVDQIQLDGLRADLVKHKDGKTNFDDLLGAENSDGEKQEAPAEAADPANAQAPIRLEVEGIRISKAALAWKDEASGAAYAISDFNLKTGRVASGVPGKFDLGATIRANEPKLDVKVQVGGTLTADLEKQVYSVAGLTVKLNGDAAGVTGLAAELQAEIEARTQSQQVDIGKLKIEAAGGLGKDSFKARVTAPKIQIRGSALSVSGLDANVGGVFAGVNLSEGNLRIPHMTLNLETRVFHLSQLSGEFDVASPSLPMKKLRIPLSGNVGADLKKQTANADLSMKLDESNIKAKFAVSDFAAPRSTFDIAIDKLNVDKYLPSKKPGEPAKAPAGPQAEQPIDFSPIKKLDVAGSLRIGDLVASNIKAQAVRVDIKVKGGRLDADPISASLYQGSMKGQASVDANNTRIAVKQNLSGISIGPLLRDAAGQNLLEGRGNVVLDVTTTGDLISAMKKTLNGMARFELKDGAIKGINLAQSLRNAKAMFSGGKPETERGATAGEKTDFSELTASFTIKNGIAHNGDFLAKSPFLRLTGEGDINLPDSTLNYVAKAAVVASGAGQGGKEIADLKGVTVPVRASGPFTALKYKVELGSVFSDSGKQKLEEQKEVIKDKLKSKLLGKSTEPSAPAVGGEQASGQSPVLEPKPRDKLKEKLKKLF